MTRVRPPYVVRDIYGVVHSCLPTTVGGAQGVYLECTSQYFAWNRAEPDGAVTCIACIAAATKWGR